MPGTEARVEWRISQGERPCSAHRWATVCTLPPGTRRGWQTACLNHGCTAHALFYPAAARPCLCDPNECYRQALNDEHYCKRNPCPEGP